MLRSDIGGEAQRYGWIIAIAICIFAAIVSNFGLNLQKLALMRKQSGKPKGVYRSLWLGGFLCIVLGAIGDFAALAFGAQSIVAPLGSLTLVSNVIIAPIFLGERVSRQDLAATGVIVAGCALAVAFASHADSSYTLTELFELYETVSFLAYASTIVVVIISALLGIRWIERIQARHGERSPEYQKVMKVHRFSYAAISGIIGAQSILFAKTCVELITDSIAGGALFLAKPGTYGILFGMGCSISLQIYWLNCGLARWDALYNVPVFQSFWIMVSVLGGGVFYNEFDDFSLTQCFMFPVGVIFTIVGVYYLSQRDSEAAQKVRDAADSLEGSALLGAINHDQVEQSALLRTEALSTASHAFEGMKEVSIVLYDRFLGLSLRLARLRIATATNHHVVRKTRAWIVSGLPQRPDGEIGEAERTGRVKVGDVLVAVNGESLLNRWITHTDAIRRIMNTTRPLALTFRVAHDVPDAAAIANNRRVRRSATEGTASLLVPDAGTADTAHTSSQSAYAATPGRLPQARDPSQSARPDLRTSGRTQAWKDGATVPLRGHAEGDEGQEEGDEGQEEGEEGHGWDVFPLQITSPGAVEERRDVQDGKGGGRQGSSDQDDPMSVFARRRIEGRVSGTPNAKPSAGEHRITSDHSPDPRSAAMRLDSQDTVRSEPGHRARTASLTRMDTEDAINGTLERTGLDLHGAQHSVHTMPYGGKAGRAVDTDRAGSRGTASSRWNANLVTGGGGGGGRSSVRSSGSGLDGSPIKGFHGATSAAEAQDLMEATRDIGIEIRDTDLNEGDDDEVELVVKNDAEAESAGDAITHAHHNLRHISMDPMMGIFHIGGLIGPRGMDDAARHDSKRRAHPVAAMMEKVFPVNGRQWNVLDRFLDSFSRKQPRARTDPITGSPALAGASPTPQYGSVAAVHPGAVDQSLTRSPLISPGGGPDRPRRRSIGGTPSTAALDDSFWLSPASERPPQPGKYGSSIQQQAQQPGSLSRFGTAISRLFAGDSESGSTDTAGVTQAVHDPRVTIQPRELSMVHMPTSAATSPADAVATAGTHPVSAAGPPPHPSIYREASMNPAAMSAHTRLTQAPHSAESAEDVETGGVRANGDTMGGADDAWTQHQLRNPALARLTSVGARERSLSENNNLSLDIWSADTTVAQGSAASPQLGPVTAVGGGSHEGGATDSPAVAAPDSGSGSGEDSV